MVCVWLRLCMCVCMCACVLACVCGVCVCVGGGGGMWIVGGCLLECAVCAVSYQY